MGSQLPKPVHSVTGRIRGTSLAVTYPEPETEGMELELSKNRSLGCGHGRNFFYVLEHSSFE